MTFDRTKVGNSFKGRHFDIVDAGFRGLQPTIAKLSYGPVELAELHVQHCVQAFIIPHGISSQSVAQVKGILASVPICQICVNQI